MSDLEDDPGSVRKCQACGHPVKNHQGPYGVGKCLNTKKAELPADDDKMADLRMQLANLTHVVTNLQSTKSSAAASGSSLSNAGEAYDQFLSQQSLVAAAVEPNDHAAKSYQLADPRSTLTLRGSSKTVHVTQFLSDKAKSKRRVKNQDLVLATEGEEKAFIIRSEERNHPYHGISIDEWGAANTRLMHHLFQTGMLKREDTEYYLAYTATIFDFCQNYEWHSVLEFDYAYREQQNAHQFTWGYINPTMELQMLIPKARSHPPNRPQPKVSQPCRQWLANEGWCRFGNNCKFDHPTLSRPNSMESSNNNNQSKNWGAPRHM